MSLRHLLRTKSGIGTVFYSNFEVLISIGENVTVNKLVTGNALNPFFNELTLQGLAFETSQHSKCLFPKS
jgi:hypothetical protein